MNELDAWKAFEISGSVFDYLKFKNLAENTKGNEKNENENSRTRTQTTEYR